MNKIIYENQNLVLYFSFITFEFYKQTSICDLEIISFKDLIELISVMPDISEVEKRLAIIEAGKLAGILEEIA